MFSFTLTERHLPVLVDDALWYDWETAGSIFLHRRNPEQTLNALTDYGIFDTTYA
jgi:hypothetical protein